MNNQSNNKLSKFTKLVIILFSLNMIHQVYAVFKPTLPFKTGARPPKQSPRNTGSPVINPGYLEGGVIDDKTSWRGIPFEPDEQYISSDTTLPEPEGNGNTVDEFNAPIGTTPLDIDKGWSTDISNSNTASTSSTSKKQPLTCIMPNNAIQLPKLKVNSAKKNGQFFGKVSMMIELAEYCEVTGSSTEIFRQLMNGLQQPGQFFNWRLGLDLSIQGNANSTNRQSFHGGVRVEYQTNGTRTVTQLFNPVWVADNTQPGGQRLSSTTEYVSAAGSSDKPTQGSKKIVTTFNSGGAKKITEYDEVGADGKPTRGSRKKVTGYHSSGVKAREEIYDKVDENDKPIIGSRKIVTTYKDGIKKEQVDEYRYIEPNGVTKVRTERIFKSSSNNAGALQGKLSKVVTIYQEGNDSIISSEELYDDVNIDGQPKIGSRKLVIVYQPGGKKKARMEMYNFVGLDGKPLYSSMGSETTIIIYQSDGVTIARRERIGYSPSEDRASQGILIKEVTIYKDGNDSIISSEELYDDVNIDGQPIIGSDIHVTVYQPDGEITIITYQLLKTGVTKVKMERIFKSSSNNAGALQGKLSKEVTIYQDGNDSIVIRKELYDEVGADGKPSIDSNIHVTVYQPDGGITIITYQLLKTGVTKVKMERIFKSSSNNAGALQGKLSKEVTIYQDGNDSIVISKELYYEVDAEGKPIIGSRANIHSYNPDQSREYQVNEKGSLRFIMQNH